MNRSLMNLIMMFFLIALPFASGCRDIEELSNRLNGIGDGEEVEEGNDDEGGDEWGDDDGGEHGDDDGEEDGGDDGEEGGEEDGGEDGKR